MDNVFVFAVIFSYFAVPPQYQHRVLFWGILGAVVMRLTFILVGAALLERYHWLIYPMGVFLVLTGIKLFFKQESDTDLSKNWVVRIARFVLPMTNEYVGQRFFVRVESLPVLATPVLDETAPDANAPPAKPIRVSHGLFGWHATPLLLVLLVVETTDVAFAVDSIPAIFGVTQDPFIVFTSNVFAILGLRALYFLLAGAMQLFRYLNVGLALILCFVGTKMLISHWIEIPIALSLAVVAAILAISIGVSLIVARAELRRVLVSPDVDEKYDGLHEGMST
jgi:tellurite resistance protein TerC